MERLTYTYPLKSDEFTLVASEWDVLAFTVGAGSSTIIVLSSPIGLGQPTFDPQDSGHNMLPTAMPELTLTGMLGYYAYARGLNPGEISYLTVTVGGESASSDNTPPGPNPVIVPGNAPYSYFYYESEAHSSTGAERLLIDGAPASVEEFIDPARGAIVESGKTYEYLQFDVLDINTNFNTAGIMAFGIERGGAVVAGEDGKHVFQLHGMRDTTPVDFHVIVSEGGSPVFTYRENDVIVNTDNFGDNRGGASCRFYIAWAGDGFQYNLANSAGGTLVSGSYAVDLSTVVWDQVSFNASITAPRDSIGGKIVWIGA